MPAKFKKKRAVIHAVSRAKERFGVTLSAADLLRLNRKIWAGDAIEFSKKKRNGKKYFVEVREGEYLPVVFHTKLYRIVTVLGANMPEVRRGLAKAGQPILLAGAGHARLRSDQCQVCGSKIGWMGRLWQLIRLPMHRCAPVRKQLS